MLHGGTASAIYKRYSCGFQSQVKLFSSYQGEVIFIILSHRKNAALSSTASRRQRTPNVKTIRTPLFFSYFPDKACKVAEIKEKNVTKATKRKYLVIYSVNWESNTQPFCLQKYAVPLRIIPILSNLMSDHPYFALISIALTVHHTLIHAKLYYE